MSHEGDGPAGETREASSSVDRVVTFSATHRPGTPTARRGRGATPSRRPGSTSAATAAPRGATWPATTSGGSSSRSPRRGGEARLRTRWRRRRSGPPCRSSSSSSTSRPCRRSPCVSAETHFTRVSPPVFSCRGEGRYKWVAMTSSDAARTGVRRVCVRMSAKEQSAPRHFLFGFVKQNVSKAIIARPRPLHTPTAGSSPPSCKSTTRARSADGGTSSSSI